MRNIFKVSIHTRHYWRVKHTNAALSPTTWSFNPHPPLLAGETSLRNFANFGYLPFQSTPAITGG